ncbi:MAG: cysteine--tRNA ligase [Pseudomonadota bacterium]
MLKIHNSLTKQKEPFTPRVPGKVGMYVCGMTVYDYCHVGHARVMVVFDVVARYLRASGYDVTYVRNITDIDDKIIKRAAENGETMAALTERFIAAMHEDSAALGVLPPDHEPRATTSIDEIIAMIGRLVERGYAYHANNGDVYYDVSRFENYGTLSGKRVEDLRVGERVAVDEAKDDPLDFVLWKSAKPGEPSWTSPWGAGRPGWHIECSAMSTKCLGDHFDIHGGGMDLMFPHHENEIAQSEAATGHHFVNYWLHNGFVQINEEKMSKSLGNFFTVREVLKHYQPEVVRYFILSSHYRSPLNYSTQNLDSAKAALDRFYTALRDVSASAVPVDFEYGFYATRFNAAMDDDFNTPEAIAVLFDIARELNRAKADNKQDEAVAVAGILHRLSGVLGILQANPDTWLKQQGPRRVEAIGTASGTASVKGVGYAALDSTIVEQLIKDRYAAREAKNWKESDRIRDELKAQGVILEDGPQGTTWRRP